MVGSLGSRQGLEPLAAIPPYNSIIIIRILNVRPGLAVYFQYYYTSPHVVIVIQETPEPVLRTLH